MRKTIYQVGLDLAKQIFVNVVHQGIYAEGYNAGHKAGLARTKKRMRKKLRKAHLHCSRWD